MNKLLLIFLLLCQPIHAASWDCIHRSSGMCDTWKMWVTYGWIVSSDNSGNTYAMVFVPDAKHEWKD